MTTARRRAAHIRALALLAVLVLIASGAAAHLGLRRSAPSDGAHLAEAVRELRLTFTEAVDTALTRIRVLGPSDVAVPISPLAHAGDSTQVIVARIEGPLQAGPYRIEWQVTGADGHPVRGTITYVIAPGATGLDDPARRGPDSIPALPDSAGAGGHDASHHDPRSMPMGGSFDAESPGYIAIRALQFLSLLTVLGALTFAIVVLGLLGRTETIRGAVRDMRARAAGFGAIAAGALLVTALARLYAQSLAMHGAGDALDLELVRTMVTRTGWGSGWMLEVGAACLAIIGFVFARRDHARGWAIATGAGLGLALTPALSGHAVATPGRAITAVIADMLHVIGAAGWIGSLLFVLAVGIPVAMRLDADLRGVTVARLINAFSPAALAFATMLVLTGVFAAWLHIGFSSALWTSDYGVMLLRKLVVLAAVIALGAWNWLRVKPTLGTDEAAHRLKRSATTELALAVVIVFITAALVATPPPGDEPDTSATQVERRAEP